jgi:hypothetical protein
MLPKGKREQFTKVSLQNYWKDEAYAEIKSKNEILQKEVERLWTMVQHFTTGAKPNFLKPSRNADSAKVLKMPATESLMATA